MEDRRAGHRGRGEADEGHQRPLVDQYREQLQKIQGKVEHAKERVEGLGSGGDLMIIADLLDQISWLVDEAVGWNGSTT